MTPPRPVSDGARSAARTTRCRARDRDPTRDARRDHGLDDDDDTIESIREHFGVDDVADTRP